MIITIYYLLATKIENPEIQTSVMRYIITYYIIMSTAVNYFQVLKRNHNIKQKK